MPTKNKSSVSFDHLQSMGHTFAFILIAGGIFGILAAHIPALKGHPWSFCVKGGNTLDCILVVHLFEVPCVLFNFFVAWYLLNRYEYKTRVRTFYLLFSLVAVDLTFFAYEIGTILVGIRRSAPLYETIILTCVSLILIGGSLLGIYILYQMVPSAFRWSGVPVRGDGLPELGEDGFYHPANESEVSALVKYAAKHKLKVRVRGATHSCSWAIYTDQGTQPNSVTIQQAPGGNNINIMLDKMNAFRWLNNDSKTGIAEVEAGIHIGIDPYDPADVSDWCNGLLMQANEHGWTLDDLGGITHQTVGGFLSTGSAGGSLVHGLEENFIALKIVDGRGEIRWVEEGEDLFHAAGVSMGLLGIIIGARIKFTPNFNIEGSEIIVPHNPKNKHFRVEVINQNQEKEHMSMSQFLEANEYSRILWYPQNGLNRLALWTAQRCDFGQVDMSSTRVKPYREFEKKNFLTYLEEIGAAILFTIAGNNGFLNTLIKLGSSFANFHTDIHWLWSRKIGRFLSYIFTGLFVSILWLLALIFVILPFSVFKKLFLKLFPVILKKLQPITTCPADENGKRSIPSDAMFRDFMYRSLPMDNGASDIMMGIEFTELWIPMEHADKAMDVLNTHFKENGSSATGYSMTELYAGRKSKFWLSPAYEGNVLRIDFFWYRANEGDPSDRGAFYDQFWRLFRNNNIPYRLHWGKYLPNYDHKNWAKYLKSLYPRWNDFMKLREQMDPENVFLTDYWKQRMDIQTEEPLPNPERALVISGGGARGAWGVGVAQALHQAPKYKNKYQLVVGTSTGSLMGPLVLLGGKKDFDKLIDQYTSITQKDIFNVNPFRKNGNIRPLLFIWRLLTGKETVGETFQMKNKIREVFTQEDYERIKSEKLEFAAAITSMTTSWPAYKSTQDYSYDDMVDWIWASANTPVFMSNLHKEGEVWADGGMRVFIPIAYAMERGAINIDILVHDNENFGSVDWSQKGGFFDLLLRVLAIYYTGTGVANVENLGLEDVVAKTEHTLNFYFMSQRELDLIGNDLVMDKTKMEKILKQGREDLTNGDLKAKTCHIAKGQPIGTIRLQDISTP